jgi:hypothetical protein
MPDELHVLLFDVRGDIQFPEREVHADAGQATQKAGQATQKDSRVTELLGDLTRKAETIGRTIERELRRILPPTVTVQANIQFEEGSVLVAGTVALLSWAAPIVRDAAKKELGELVKLAIKRVISRYLLPHVGAALEMSVAPQSTVSDLPPAVSDHPPAFAGGKISASTALFVITGLILILQILTLLDRAFLIHIRP